MHQFGHNLPCQFFLATFQQLLVDDLFLQEFLAQPDTKAAVVFKLVVGPLVLDFWDRNGQFVHTFTEFHGIWKFHALGPKLLLECTIFVKGARSLFGFHMPI
jgi:hypothetical protein